MKQTDYFIFSEACKQGRDVHAYNTRDRDIKITVGTHKIFLHLIKLPPRADGEGVLSCVHQEKA